MRKTIIAISILIVIISIVITLLFVNNLITGRAIEDEISLKNYSYTKAICDNEKYCQDYIINCNGEEVVSINPITGAAVQFPPSWEDPRTEEEISKLCD